MDQLASLSGTTTRQVIYDYESGRRQPSIKVLEVFSAVLNCEFVIKSEKKAG